MTEQTALADTPLEDARNRSLPDDLRDLAGHARSYAEAEVAFQKSRAVYAGREARTIAILGVLAVVFVYFALMGLVFGAIISLAAALTPLGATGAVCGVLVVLAAACALLARARLKRVTRNVRAGDPA